MARTSDSRAKLIDAARALFLERGYAATSITDITGAVGVTKGSFFHHFKSKEELALEALLNDFEATAEALSGGSFAAIQDPIRRTLAFLDHTDRIAPRVWGGGSMLGSFAAGLAATSPRIATLVGRAYKRLAAGLAPIFEPVATRAGMDGAELAEQFLATVEGGALLARAHDAPMELELALNGFRRYVEMLVKER